MADGTSSTIRAVEACFDHSVTRTKLNDLEFDFDNPVAGFESARLGRFHPLFADEAVRIISNNISMEDLTALHLREGSNAIGDFGFHGLICVQNPLVTALLQRGNFP